MIHSILKTDPNNSGYAIIRILLAIVILAHGAQKLLGFFGGYGFEGTMNYFTETAGLPWVIGFLVILGESLGALLLFMGFLSRITAASILIIMAGAGFMHWENGFFMNWFGSQAGEGVEFFILAMGMAAQITMKGGGLLSVDAFLMKFWNEKNTVAKHRKLETSV